jgi:hydrogenase-1 operon protein HyaE
VADAGTEVPRHPLVERLVTGFGLPEVGASDVDEFLAGRGDAVLLFTEDPKKYPESADVAVILPELMKAFAGRFRAAVVARASERELQKRFGFARWPALVFVRGGDIVGTLTGVHDWDDFIEQVSTLLESPTRRELAAAAVRANEQAASDSGGRT